MPGRSLSPSGPRLHVLAVGAFGRQTAERLARTHPALVVTEPSPGPARAWSATWPLADVHVLATWREAPDIARSLDAAAFAWRKPWIPVVYEHPYLRVGPTVVPGAGPCYHCFFARSSQHSTMADLVDALRSYYEVNPDAGTVGFLPAHAALAAAMAHEVLDGLAAGGADEPGLVRQVNVSSLRVAHGRLIGVHGCPRCGSGREPRSRSVVDLERDLRPVLEGAS